MWGRELMQQMPRIAGNADPIHYSQMLPGVQTNGEYRGGINVQGCDNAHTMLSIGGVPIYNANHLLGIFSTFTPSHYPAMTLNKGVTTACHPARLGARLDMQLPYAPEQIESPSPNIKGELECGIISSQGTLHIQCDKNTLLTLSGRGAYLNLLYGKFLEVDGNAINYSFGDANLTLSHRRGHHTITFDSYYGTDIAGVETAKAVADFRCQWANNMQALHWNTEGEIQASTTLSHTGYNNDFRLNIYGDILRLPSSIDDYTLQTDITVGRWHTGAQASCYDIIEQHPAITNNYITPTTTVSSRQSALLTLYADYTLPLISSYLTLNTGLRPSLYVGSDHSTHLALDPHVSLNWRSGVYDCTISWAMRHQHLFFVGVTDIGLPTEFWLGATSNLPPQWAHGVTLSAGAWLHDRKWRIDIDGYYKRMLHQQEYAGSILDYLDSNYSPTQKLCPGAGYNYGGSIMLSHPIGPWIGWIAYSYTRATRKSDKIPTSKGHFPASHERPHELNAVVTYAIGSHWQLSTTGVLASGTPFTAPRHFYLLGASLISEYNEHNANRLPPYFRIDLSATYKWRRHHRLGQSVNVSLYNVTAHENALFYALCTHKNDNNFHYKPTSFFTRILPSISYSVLI